MTLEEAIGRNIVLRDAPILRDDPHAVETFTFNIEALKRIQKGRETGALGVSRLLPGETEK